MKTDSVHLDKPAESADTSLKTAEPVAWLMITPIQEHHIILWDQSEVDRYEGMGDAVIQPLYAHPANDDLVAAASQAQCSCTVRERDSGHQVGCWMPDLIAALAKAGISSKS